MNKFCFKKKLFGFKKSREKCIKHGSRNTSCFHTQTIIRRKRNRVHGLHLPSGAWCTDANMLKEEAVKYFKELLIAQQDVRNGVQGECRTHLSNLAKK